MFENLAIIATIVVGVVIARVARRFDRNEDAGRFLLITFSAFAVWAVQVGVAVGVPNETLKETIGFFYLLQTTFYIVLYGVWVRWRVIEFLRPSMMSIMYLGLTMGLGALIFAAGAVVKQADLANYLSWREMAGLYVAISAAFLVTFVVALSARVGLTHERPGSGTPKLDIVSTAVLFGIMVATLVSDSVWMSVVWTVLACAVFFNLFKSTTKTRWLMVAITVALIAVVSFNSKRNAIFLLYPAFLLEAKYGTPKLTWKWVVSGLFIGAVAVYLILAMSQLRGTVNAHRTFQEALSLVPAYVASPESLKFISNNFELGSVFYHAHNAIRAALFFDYLHSMGETYWKTIFVGIPPEALNYKPRSFVELYTNYADPAFRSIGGSYAATIIGEAFWNFGIWGLGILALIMSVMDRLFRFLEESLSRFGVAGSALCLACIEFMLLAIRGSGFDLWLAYSYVALGVAVGVVLPVSLIFRPATRSSTAVAQRSLR